MSYGMEETNLFPVHKKGDRSNIENYRGISALCAISKLFEIIVFEPTFAHCKVGLADEQHGFMPKRSTATNLLCFTSYVFDSFADCTQTDAIYTDLSAAFDTINHRIAVAKLDRFGIGGDLLRWFESYLTGRTLCVRIGDATSDPFIATSGIAQGSHLGPLIYNIYSNDANYSLDGPHLSFADDMKLFLRIKSPADSIVLQQQINSFAQWCNQNCMLLNTSKCSVVTFSRKLHPLCFNYEIDGTTIPRTDNIKDLGVILDTRLTFKQHISFVVAKASRQLGLIMRMTRDFRSIQCLKSLYCSLVRSSLEYCSTVWNPHYHNAAFRIESIQRRFVRYSLRLLPWRQPMRDTPYEHRCQLLQLDTLQLRRDTARALTVADILTGRIDCSDILRQINIRAPSRLLRMVPLLHPPFRRANYSANSAIVGLQRAFNRIAYVFDFHLPRAIIRSRIVCALRSLLYH